MNPVCFLSRYEFGRFLSNFFVASLALFGLRFPVGSEQCYQYIKIRIALEVLSHQPNVVKKSFRFDG